VRHAYQGKSFISLSFILIRYYLQETSMKRIVGHIIIPALLPAIFLVIARTPVEVLGCRTRGLTALLIALVSGLAALVTAMRGAKERARGHGNATWWVVSTLILVLPVIALIILA
jgi:hypothetical protein